MVICRLRGLDLRKKSEIFSNRGVTSEELLLQDIAQESCSGRNQKV